jgi:hypothetical protein
MKGIAAVTLLLVLFSGPVLCFVLACPAQAAAHSCCPRGGSLAACPYDFLTTPSGTITVHKWIGLAATPVAADQPVPIQPEGHATYTVVANARNLHVLNRILRI